MDLFELFKFIGASATASIVTTYMCLKFMMKFQDRVLDLVEHTIDLLKKNGGNGNGK